MKVLIIVALFAFVAIQVCQSAPVPDDAAVVAAKKDENAAPAAEAAAPKAEESKAAEAAKPEVVAPEAAAPKPADPAPAAPSAPVAEEKKEA